MALKHRLDRFISLKTGIPKKEVRHLLAQNLIEVNGLIATHVNQIVDQFSYIKFKGKTLQNKPRMYLMMHKPVGIVSATKDEQHLTVIDVLHETIPSDIRLTQDEIESLHIVGRLDRNSSGLLLLTNDSEWSKALMSPDNKVIKVYHVSVQDPISDDCISAFSEGIYFPFENITTKPAKLEKLSETYARVTLTEGKYHQIKRMFGRFRNPVLSIHRIKVGYIELSSELKPGECQLLTKQEGNEVICVS